MDWREVGKMCKGGQKVQTFSYKINKSWDMMCSMATIVNYTVLHVLFCLFEKQIVSYFTP